MLRIFLFVFLGAQLPLLGPLDGGGLPPIDLDRVQVGQIAPDFRLMDDQEVIRQLSRYQGVKNVVLVVYRGHW